MQQLQKAEQVSFSGIGRRSSLENLLGSKEVIIYQDMIDANTWSSKDNNRVHNSQWCTSKGYRPIAPAFQIESIVYNSIKQHINGHNSFKFKFREKTQAGDKIIVEYSKKNDSVYSIQVLKEGGSLAMKGEVSQKQIPLTASGDLITLEYGLNEKDAELFKKGTGDKEGELNVFYPISLTSNLFIEFFNKYKEHLLKQASYDTTDKLAAYLGHEVAFYEPIRQLSLKSKYSITLHSFVYNERNGQGFCTAIATGSRESTRLFDITAQMGFVDEGILFK